MASWLGFVCNPSFFYINFILALDSHAAISKGDSVFNFELDKIQGLPSRTEKLKGSRKLFQLVKGGNFENTAFAFTSSLQIHMQMLVLNGRADSALLLVQQNLFEYKLGKELDELGRMYLHLAELSFKQNLFFSSRLYLDSAEFYVNESGDFLGEILVEELFLRVYTKQNKPDAILGRMPDILKIQRDSIAKNAILSQLFDELLMSIYSSAALANRQLRNTEKAIEYFSKAEELSDNLNLLQSQINIWIELADCNLSLNRLSTAEKYLGAALKEASAESWLEEQTKIDILRAELLRRRKRPERALSILSDLRLDVETLSNLEIKSQYFDEKSLIFKNLKLTDSAESNGNLAAKARAQLLDQAWLNERKEWEKHLVGVQNLRIAQLQEKLQNQTYAELEGQEEQKFIRNLLAISLVVILALVGLWIGFSRKSKRAHKITQKKLNTTLIFQKALIHSLVQNIRSHSLALEIGPEMVLRKLKLGKIHDAYSLLSSLEKEYQDLDHTLTHFIRESDSHILKSILNSKIDLNISEYIQKEIKQHSVMLKERGIVVLQEFETAKVYRVNGLLFELVFRNLLFNSIQHSTCKQIQIRFSGTEQNITLEFRDNGMGLSSELLEFLASKEAVQNPSLVGFGFWFFQFNRRELEIDFKPSQDNGWTVFTLSLLADEASSLPSNSIE